MEADCNNASAVDFDSSSQSSQPLQLSSKTRIGIARINIGANGHQAKYAHNLRLLFSTVIVCLASDVTANTHP
jgi:hypothetical protein